MPMMIEQETKVERDYVAICIAEQIVRVKIAVTRGIRAGTTSAEAGQVVLRPLNSLATTLGVREQVDTLVAEVLPGAV
jgi:hypothetical protein